MKVVGRGLGGRESKRGYLFLLYIRSMNGTSNRRTWQVGGEAE